MLFRVLVIAPGRRPVVTEYVDPSERELLQQLSAIPDNLPPNRLLRGRVVDENGTPVAGALVTPTGAKTSEGRWWGALPGVDAASATDDQGHFAIVSSDPKLGLDLQVEAPGYAIRPGELFALDGSQHEIRLQRGAAVHGRLLWDGKPVLGRTVGMVQRDRSAGRFVGEVTLATDGDGRFFFPNLQPNERYVLYTLCSGRDDEPVLKTRTIETGANNADLDVGDLALIDGFTLAGRIELPAGAVLAGDAKLRISRDPAWDWCEFALASDGSFAVRGLPPEVLTVSIMASGFTLDGTRLRFQSVGDNRFALRLREDLNDLVIPMRANR